MNQVPGPSTSFAERFNYLLERFGKELADVIEGTGISKTYLYYLKKGERENVTQDVLEKIANYFGVSPLFFSSTPENWVPPIPSSAIQFALRTAGNLDPEAQKMLESLIERARQLAAGAKPTNPE